MMYKVQRCFCCVPIQPAIHIIGFWMCLSLLGQIASSNLNPILLVLNLAALGFFINMAQNDTAKNREYFFFMFAVYMIGIYAMLVWKSYERSTDQNMIEKICVKMQKEGEFKEELIRTMTECQERIQNSMEMAFWLVIPIGAFVFYHLSAVVYTHWKKFGKPQEEEEGQHMQQIDEEAQ